MRYIYHIAASSVLVEVVVALFHGDSVGSESVFVLRKELLQMYLGVYAPNELAGAEVAQQTFGFSTHLDEVYLPSSLPLL